MSACPDVESLMNDSQAGAHLAECAACRAIVALADQHRASLRTENAEPVACAEVDAWLAAQLLGDVSSTRAAQLRAHIVSCAACMALAHEVEEPGVADAIFDLNALPTSDFADLRTVEVDNYTRGAEIGRGGMGRIVRARDRRLGRAVAIKELLDDKLRARFEREARLTARLQHPAIVNIHEAGRWPSGAPFYVMKYVAGEPLERRIARTRNLSERLALLPNVITVVEALAYAHAERIIHRDLKPANILVGPFGETVVIDWGLAKDLDERVPDVVDASAYRGAEVLTVGGIGTPQYMPPEQADGQMADPRLDVYALGATLYQTLSGRLPYGDVSTDRVLALLKSEAPPPLTDAAPGVPLELAAIVAKAMARKPDERYASAAELADELKRFQTGQLVSAHHYSMGDLWGRWLRKHRAPIALATIFVVLLGGVGAVSVSRVFAARRSAEQQLTELLFERGQRELADGQPSRALIYLSQAVNAGMDTPALRYLVGEASRPLAALTLTKELPYASKVLAADISADGSRVLVVSEPGGARFFDGVTGLPNGRLNTSVTVHVPDRVRFSPDGTHVLGEAKHAALLWDARSGELVATLSDQPLAFADFTGDGRFVTVGFGEMKSWTADGTLVTTAHVDFSGHRMGLTRDGKRLVGFDPEQRGGVWDVATGARLVTFDGAPCPIPPTEVALDPSDARAFVACAVDERIFDLATGHTVETLPAADDSIYAAQLDTDGRLLTLGFQHSARNWTIDPDTGKRRVGREMQGRSSHLFTVDATGKQIVTVAADDTVQVWRGDHGEGEILQDIPGARPAAVRVAGDALVILADDGVLRRWRLQPSYAPLDGTSGPSVGTDGGARVVRLGHGGASVVDVASGRTIATTDVGLQVVTLTRDGRHVIGARWDGRFVRWDLDTGAMVDTTAPLPEGSEVTAVNPDGDRLLVRSDATHARLLDAGGAPIAALEASYVQFSPDASFVFGIRADGFLGMWDARSGSPRGAINVAYTHPTDQSIKARSRDTDGLLVSRRGDRAITTLTHDSKLAAIWDGRGNRIADLYLGDNGGMLMNATGDRLLSFDAGGGLRLWNLDTGKEMAALRTTVGWLFTDAVFSPDGRLIYGKSGDRMQVWEADSGELRASLPVPGLSGNITVLPDGRHALLNWYWGEVGAGFFDLHQAPIDRAALDALVAKVPYRLDGGRLLPK